MKYFIFASVYLSVGSFLAGLWGASDYDVPWMTAFWPISLFGFALRLGEWVRGLLKEK